MPFFTKIIFLEKNCIDSNLGHCVALKKKKNEKKSGCSVSILFGRLCCDDGFFFLKRDKKKQTKLDLQKNEKKKKLYSMFS